MSIIESCPSVSDLTLTGVHQWQTWHDHMWHKLVRLRRLTMCGVTRTGLFQRLCHVLPSCPLLEWLDIRGAVDAFEKASDGKIGLTIALPSLQYLAMNVPSSLPGSLLLTNAKWNCPALRGNAYLLSYHHPSCI